MAAKFVYKGGREHRGGVQSWIRTVADKLEKNYGCEVIQWEPGMKPPEGTFDWGIFAHWRLTQHLGKLCGKVTNVCHGIISTEEPVGSRAVFVSRGVAAHWGFPESRVLHQPIDLSFWHPQQIPDPKKLVRYSYRYQPTHSQVVAESLGLKFEKIGDVTHEVARREIQSAAVVFASGRAALEAMACGVPTVVYDNREYQGPMMCKSLVVNMMNSYSGRGGLKNPTSNDVKIAAIQAMSEHGDFFREWICQAHNADDIVEELVAECRPPLYV